MLRGICSLPAAGISRRTLRASQLPRHSVACPQWTSSHLRTSTQANIHTCSRWSRLPTPITVARAAEPEATPSASPWSKEDISKLVDEQEQFEETLRDAKWRSEFADRPELLYDYVDEATAEWSELLGTLMTVIPKADWENNAAVRAAANMPAAVANDVIGMGTWRLRADVDPCVEFLVSRFEGCWREIFNDDLNLYPAGKWKDGGFDFCDSMDPQRELDGYSYGDIPDPEKGQEGYPRLLIENRIYCSRVFRKLHIEVAHRTDGMHVFHCVLYPRYCFDLPILAVDLVVFGEQVTLAIVDACPVRKNMYLPPLYMQTMKELQDQLLTDPNNQRKIPDWGKEIFSPLCVCLRPNNAEELAGFLKYTVALHRAHLSLARNLDPVLGIDKRGVARLNELLDGHKRFCDQQLLNKKTVRVLEAAFGAEWAEQYMTQIMFDFDPEDDPAFEDASVQNLYDYFEKAPELGPLPDETRQLRMEQDRERAETVLTQLASGEGGINHKRLEFAMQHLYDSDPGFRTSVAALVPDPSMLEFGRAGQVLAALLQDEDESGQVEKAWTK